VSIIDHDLDTCGSSMLSLQEFISYVASFKLKCELLREDLLASVVSLEKKESG